MILKTSVLALVLLGAISFAPAAVITVTTTDNGSGPGDGQTSLVEALQQADTGDTIAFNIPGAGPHVIQTPLGGYPLITKNNLTIDGYTQPGAAANSNPILGGNNAQIKIVLDSTAADSGPNPVNPTLPLRRSTRLDFPEHPGNTGYGTSENGVLAVFEADHVTIRGLSFIARHTPGSDADPSIYCVAFVRQATHGKVQGCWFGLPPGGTSMAQLQPAASAVAAFRWRIGGDVYSENLIVGTDGDGVNDRAEFNLILGSRIGLALELPRAKISGNYFNVFPNGLSFVNVDAVYQQLTALGGGDSVENIENGRVTENSVIGTNGDGVADAEERNIFAHAVYDHNIEFYSNAQGLVVAGNYFGVGIDGVTAAPIPTNARPNLIELPANGSIRLGSDGDGVSDALEGNLVVNVPGNHYCPAGTTVLIATRGNSLVNNVFNAIPFSDGDNNRFYNTYYASAMVDPSQARPVLGRIASGQVSGSFSLPSSQFPNAVIDLYAVDPLALVKEPPASEVALVHPRTLLATLSDDGANDLDPRPGAFTIDVSSLGLAPSTYIAVAVSYSMDTASTEAGRSVTSPMSNPVSIRPRLEVKLVPYPDIPELHLVRLSWLGAQDAFDVESNGVLEPAGWGSAAPIITHSNGRNTADLDHDPSPGVYMFYRLVTVP